VTQPVMLASESDYFVGRRGRLTRYLVCALQGYFPVLAATGPASLAVIFRTGAAHVGITGTLAVSTSADGGKSWSDPVEIAPRGADCRNPAFGVAADGALIAAYWKAGLHAYEDTDGRGLRYTGGNKEAYAGIPAMCVARSADGGRTWQHADAYASELLALASPYGRIISAPDGTLLMSVYGTPRIPIEGARDICILLRSRDDGRTWGEESLVAAGYNETAYAFLPDGRLLAAARSEAGLVATLFSDDGGDTWSAPEPVTRVGEHPADLTVLRSGAVQLTFGRRIRPMGCGVLLSDDGGRTWNRDREVLLAGDGIENGDLGYPSTVQRADGGLVTVLYYAGGSEASSGDWSTGWGAVSCQAIHYHEDDLR
jgi:sialidase-1